jgi:hypothetical protein
MTTKFTTMNRKTKPISMYRYPYKLWVDYDYTKDIRCLREMSLVTQTYEVNGMTIDFKFYKGDEENFKSYIEKVLWIFGLDVSFDHSSTDYDDYDFHRYVVDYTSNTDHYTLLCNSCEVYGNVKTKKYVEIFPTKQSKEDRSERMTLYGYFDNSKFAVFENCEMRVDERENNTKTPSKLLLDNHNKKSMIDDISERVKELSSQELREIKNQIFKMKSPLKEVV